MLESNPACVNSDQVLVFEALMKDYVHSKDPTPKWSDCKIQVLHESEEAKQEEKELRSTKLLVSHDTNQEETKD